MRSSKTSSPFDRAVVRAGLGAADGEPPKTRDQETDPGVQSLEVTAP